MSTMSSTTSQQFYARYKVVLLGDSTVGKTSLIQSLEGREYNPSTLPTIGVDFIKKIFTVNDQNIMLEIWDTAGQERFHSITGFHFRGADCFVFIFDVTNRDSFTKIRDLWLKKVDEVTDDPVPIFFIGNKIDRLDRAVDAKEGNRIHEEQYSNGYFETSAKTGENVLSTFENIAQKLISIKGISSSLFNSESKPQDKEKSLNKSIRLKKLRINEQYYLTCCIHKKKTNTL